MTRSSTPQCAFSSPCFSRVSFIALGALSILLLQSIMGLGGGAVRIGSERAKLSHEHAEFATKFYAMQPPSLVKSRGVVVTPAEALRRAHADAAILPADAPPECATWLSAAHLQTSFASQWGQDAIIYYNFFAGKLAAGERGVYVDVGANAPRKMSNTWFLDRCLGWRGLCIEADPALATALRASDRTCTIVNKCAAGKVGKTAYSAQGYGGESGHVAAAGDSGTVVVDCAPIHDLIRDAGFKHVDFLTIDIEGHEVSALSGADWDAVPVEMVLVETAWSNEQLDMLFSDGGFWRISDLAYLDDLYIRAPRLLVDAPFFNAARKDNWDYIARLDINGHYKRTPAILELDKSGRVVYKTVAGNSN